MRTGQHHDIGVHAVPRAKHRRNLIAQFVLTWR